MGRRYRDYPRLYGLDTWQPRAGMYFYFVPYKDAPPSANAIVRVTGAWDSRSIVYTNTSDNTEENMIQMGYVMKDRAGIKIPPELLTRK